VTGVQTCALPISAIQHLTEDSSLGLAELEASLNRPIRLKAEVAYHPESFDVVPL
jgi:ribonuclease G